MTRDFGPGEILNRFRADAARFEELGQGAPADLLRQVANEIEAWWTERSLALVTVEEAVERSGYSEDGLRKLRAKGELSDVTGEHGERRYVLGELPRKPSANVDNEPNDRGDRIVAIRSRAGS